MPIDNDETKPKDQPEISRRDFLGLSGATALLTSPAHTVPTVKTAVRAVMNFPSIGKLTGLVQERLVAEDAVLKRMGPRFIARANRAIFSITNASGKWEYSRPTWAFHNYLKRFFEAFQDPNVVKAVLNGEGNLSELLGHFDLLGSFPDKQQHIEMALDILRTPQGRKICQLSQAIKEHPLATTDYFAHREACQNATSKYFKEPKVRDGLCEQWQAQPTEYHDGDLEEPDEKAKREVEEKQKTSSQSPEQNTMPTQAPYLSDDSRIFLEAMKRGGPEHETWREMSIKRNLNPDKERQL